MINQPPVLATKSLILILDHSCNKYCDLIGQEEVSIGLATKSLILIIDSDLNFSLAML